MAVYLQKYESEMFQALNSDGTTYILHCNKHSFFGLFKRKIKMNYTIPFHHDYKKYFDRWDHLIKTQEKLKK